MKVFVWLLAWAMCGLALGEVAVGQTSAVPAPTSPEQVDVKPQRLAMLEFRFDPEDGLLNMQILEPDGTKRYALDAINISAIGEGRTIKAELNRVDTSSFKGTLNLPEGTWNLVIRAHQREQRLEGQYELGVGKAVTRGRVPLVPPNPEVGRLTWIVGLMFGVPLGLAALVVLAAVALKQLRPKQSVV